MSTRKQEDALRPVGFFLLRTPHLPVDAFRLWGANLAAQGRCLADDDAALAEAVQLDRNVLRTRLHAFVEQRAVREAIYVASPSLHERLTKWFAQPDSKDGEKVEQAVVRYFSRMTSRATPFGLFAAFSLGHVGRETRLEISPDGRRHVRVDMEHLVRISEALEREPAIRSILHFRPNKALYKVGSRLHYPELHVEGRTRSYGLVAVDPDQSLSRALAAARPAARRDDIAAALVDGEIGLEDARGYVDELIGAHILESDLTPPITGDDPLAAMVRALEAATDPVPREARATLEQVKTGLDRLEGEPLGVGPARYEEIAALLARLAGEANPSHLFQVDMSRDAEASLATEDVAAIARGIVVLRAFGSRDEWLTSFTSAFVARYENREVPLMEALDEEVGIGFADPGAPSALPVPLIAGLHLGGPPKAATTSPWSARTQFVSRRLERAWTDGAETIRLESADWTAFVDDVRPFPSSLAALVSVLGPDSASPGTPRRFFLHSVVGASAARFLGRFCAWNAEMTALLRAHLRDEESREPQAIFAEIVHLPVGARLGNILRRPLLREHEIEFCGRSGAPEQNTIALADLRVSVRKGRVVLRSERLEREIIPRLSSAHNFGPKNLGAYRFLAALQGQGYAAGGGFGFGPFENAAFLPRVEIGNVILSARRWWLDKEDIKSLARASAVARFRATSKLREARRLPRFVGLMDGDNVLPVDLDNTLSIDAFVSVIKRRTAARLTELFAEPTDLLARSPHGHHTNEIVIPFAYTPEPPSASDARDDLARGAETRHPAAVPPQIRRQFAPGTEWLFAKIYGAPGSADDVLSTCIAPLVRSLSGGPVDRWFFVRYSDPEPHLRVRFHGPPGELLGRVLPELSRALAPLLASRRLSRLDLATYEREIERYGGDAGIELCEQIFAHDSEAALRLIDALGEGTERDRWQWALLGTHKLLDDFGLDLAARRRFADRERLSFQEEMGTTDAGQHGVAARFRKERGALEALLAGGDAAASSVFEARSDALAPLVKELRSRTSRLIVSQDDLVSSLVHMWNNRMLRTQARLHELVVHAFLARLYSSMAARRRA